jgi:hypothetical protein
MRWRIGRSASVGSGEGLDGFESVYGDRVGFWIKGEEGRLGKVWGAHEHDAVTRSIWQNKSAVSLSPSPNHAGYAPSLVLEED